MSTDHDRVRELLGPFVLGGLDAGDRPAIEAHLSTCLTCRDELASYAGLPALLRLGDGPASAPAPEIDDAALLRALHGVRRERSRRRRLRVLGSVAAAVVLVGLGASAAGLYAAQGDDPATTSTAMTLDAAAGSDVRGKTRLTARPWGTSVDLDLTGLPTDQRFVVWVVSADGTREQAATWASTPDGVAHVTGASALARGSVASVRVTTTQGLLVLSRDIAAFGG